MRVKVKRQDAPGLKPYWQSFVYDGTEKVTVAAILTSLNYRDDPVDENGKPARRIRWECGCMQKMCGACAMVMNHEPGLACSRFIDPSETDILILEPLTKFPTVTDLIVDRSCINEYLKEADLYIGTLSKADKKEFEYQYQVAKCLKCGLCLEVCPNYTGTDSEFYGAAIANESYLVHSSSADRKKEIRKGYRKHFENGCSKSLACRDVCPMKIPTLSSIGYMNRR